MLAGRAQFDVWDMRWLSVATIPGANVFEYCHSKLRSYPDHPISFTISVFRHSSYLYCWILYLLFLILGFIYENLLTMVGIATEILGTAPFQRFLTV